MGTSPNANAIVLAHLEHLAVAQERWMDVVQLSCMCETKARSVSIPHLCLGVGGTAGVPAPAGPKWLRPPRAGTAARGC